MVALVLMESIVIPALVESDSMGATVSSNINCFKYIMINIIIELSLNVKGSKPGTFCVIDQDAIKVPAKHL